MIIGIYKADVFTGRRSYSVSSGCPHAPILLVYHPYDIGMFLLIVPQDHKAVVGGTVIYAYDLNAVKCLRQKRIQTARQVSCDIIAWHDYTQFFHTVPSTLNLRKDHILYPYGQLIPE